MLMGIEVYIKDINYFSQYFVTFIFENFDIEDLQDVGIVREHLSFSSYMFKN